MHLSKHHLHPEEASVIYVVSYAAVGYSVHYAIGSAYRMVGMKPSVKQVIMHPKSK